MDTSTYIGCTGCDQNLPIGEFMGSKANGDPKQFRTCVNCRDKSKRSKKRQLDAEDDENDQEDAEIVEITDPVDICNHIMQLLNVHSESAAPIQFQCNIDMSIFDKSEKEIAEELIELIEDVDEFTWMYETVL